MQQSKTQRVHCEKSSLDVSTSAPFHGSLIILMTNLLQVEFLEEHENPFQMVTPRHNLLMAEGRRQEEKRAAEEVGDNVNGTCDESSDHLVTWTQQILPV